MCSDHEPTQAPRELGTPRESGADAGAIQPARAVVICLACRHPRRLLEHAAACHEAPSFSVTEIELMLAMVREWHPPPRLVR